MKKIVKKIISMVLSTTCILTMTAFPAFAAETSSPADRLETGLSQLEEKYDVTIKKAPTARKASALSLEEVNSTLTDLESSLIKGQQARIENHQAYEQYMKELEESGRMDTSDSSTTPDSPAPRALISRIYYHSIGTLVPNGTSIRCSMTGNTTSDAYGNTVWASLSSHSSRLNVNAPYQVPYKLKAASAALLYCFFGFLTTSGNFSDHGSRSSKNDRSLSSMCLGISVRRCSKYSYGFRLFAFAVSAML